MFKEYVEIGNLRSIMEDANEFVVERVKKLNKLMDKGVNPYPYKFENITHSNYKNMLW